MKSNLKKILKYIRLRKEAGTTIETGGNGLGTKGYYVQQTVLSNVKEYNRIKMYIPSLHM